MTYYIILKDNHRYDFNKIREIRTEYSQQGNVEILVISGQFLPRRRFKDIRILPQTIEDSNIPDIERRLLTWTS